ncbi:MAG: hypothetical protein VKJ09_06305 [Leptolyngbya sp.]|nr:hypothetical protein [Leptolyngbya sp.]
MLPDRVLATTLPAIAPSPSPRIQPWRSTLKRDPPFWSVFFAIVEI